mmetsp:Transcript_26945/g.86625  ORF Transcript_26945/g.86625 Transcript_26945/m.86625 type:complete len:1038 (-) Transcript_26945:1363-4476(-)
MRGTRAIGILREVKNKWERRAPLTPSHVADLVKQGISVYIQPSGRRVFPDAAYAAVGAKVQEDLTPAGVILGVKEVPPENLIPNRTYCFFAHVIKAQAYNMPLLDTMLEKNVRLIDYECIVENGQRGGRRLVAFGHFAGIAGMIDTSRGLGERLLTLGHSTPFLNLSSTYMYKDLEAAFKAVRECGEEVAQYGTPEAVGPLTFAFTGSGNVSHGAQEVFRLLPHEMVKVEDLPHLVKGGNADLKQVYGVQVTAEDMVQLRGGAQGAFDKQHYYQNPEAYEPVFHERVAPYVSVLLNCMYWDNKFPRLLTKRQTEELVHSGNWRMVALGDISCDIKGGVEWFSKSTAIDSPYYLYDAEADLVHDNVDDEGTLIMGIENLPAELPRDASKLFGDALLPFVPALASSDGSLPFDRQNKDLPAELYGACVTAHGALTPNFKYIAGLRRDRERLAVRTAGSKLPSRRAHKRLLLLRGHLFDYSLINRVLDMVESSECDFRLVDMRVGSNREEASSAVVELEGASDVVEDVSKKMAALCDNMSDVARTTLRELPYGAVEGAQEETVDAAGGGARGGAGGAGGASEEELASRLPASVRDMGPRKALVLGSGLVSGPLLDYLCRIPDMQVTLGSADMQEAKLRASKSPRITPKHLDVGGDETRLASAVSEHDVVISLVPATFHTRVAQACLQKHKHLVTASYVSPDMRALDAEARRLGLTFLCELGLDPGIDHMSAMKMIEEARADGGAVESFESLCGGLPAPEAADNPLGYKFSWSPRGVLLAGRNPARYRALGAELRVAGEELFRSARPITILPSLSLEHLPNRDSVPYGAAYDIAEAHTVYRGTLRYRGFSEIMHTAKALGLFSEEPLQGPPPATWGEMLARQLPNTGESVRDLLHRRLLLTEPSPEAARRVLDGLSFLGLLSDEPYDASLPPLDAFCKLLQSRLQYGPGERDMVLMHHRLGVRMANGERQTRLATLLAYGVPFGDSAMSTTVGLPAAIGSTLIMDGTIQRRGVVIPVHKDIYDPVLAELAKEGIAMTESVV